MVLVGKKDVSFVKDGQEIKGTKLFFLYDDKNVDGKACESIFASSKIDCSNMVIGKEYEPTYNKYGKPVDFVEVQ